MVDWRSLVSVNPAVCHGKPCIKGTRVMVSVILDNLAEGRSVAEILSDYPSLSPESVQAAQAYAAWLANEEDVIALAEVS